MPLFVRLLVVVKVGLDTSRYLRQTINMLSTSPRGKSRQKIAAENMSKEQRVHRQLQSGPLKRELRNAKETVWTAAGFYRQAREAMTAQGLTFGEDTFAMVVCYLSPDLTTLWTLKYIPGEEQKLNEELNQSCGVIIGLMFGVLEPGHGWLMGVRPFLDTPLVLEAFKARLSSDVLGVN
jgi:hypothetical protein